MSTLRDGHFGAEAAATRSRATTALLGSHRLQIGQAYGKIRALFSIAEHGHFICGAVLAAARLVQVRSCAIVPRERISHNNDSTTK